jgi:ParB family transcriptional regulator, chromosome partitioning protein
LACRDHNRSDISTPYSAALVEDLTAHRTAALRIALAQNPHAALAMTVHALALSLIHAGGAASCLDLRAASSDRSRHVAVTGDSPAHAALMAEGDRWGERLPGEADVSWAWCLAQRQDVLLDLLAFLAALTVDAVQTNQGKPGSHEHAERLASFLGLDMRHWWTLSVDGFFGRYPKAALSGAVAEAGVTASAPFDSVKKTEAATMTEKALRDSGWLPPPLRALP